MRAAMVTESPSMRATVLVVEDDGDVHEYSVSALTQLGHDVLQAGEASAALSVIEGRPEVDVLLTEVGLPGINGRQLASERGDEVKTGCRCQLLMFGGAIGKRRKMICVVRASSARSER
jgi:PleD family two-component response regulator